MGTNPQILSLLGQFTDSLDALPLDLTRSFGDLRELDAVLRTSTQTLSAKVYQLIDLIRDPSATKSSRLCLLLEIAEDAQRLRLGAEDKIKVAGRTADEIISHNASSSNIIGMLSSLDPQYEDASHVRRTTFPHIAPANLNPPPAEFYANGRRKRVPTGTYAMLASTSIRGVPMAISNSEQAEKSKKRRAGDDDETYTVRGTPKGKVPAMKAVEERGRERQKTKKARATQGSPSPVVEPPSYRQPMAFLSTQHENMGRTVTSVHQPPTSHPTIFHSNHPAPQQSHPQPYHYPHHTHKPTGTSSLLDVVANRMDHHPHPHQHAHRPPPTFDEDDYEGPSHPQHGNQNHHHLNQHQNHQHTQPPPPQPTPSYSQPRRRTPHSSPKTGDGVGDTDDMRTYCYCDRVSFGEMIGCDDERCRREWFHLSCLNMSAPPKGEWYCDECATRRHHQGKGGGTAKRAQRKREPSQRREREVSANGNGGYGGPRIG